MNRETDHILFERIKEGDEKAFEGLFRAYYPFLCSYATRILKDATAAEEIVQELFVKLWEKRSATHIGTSVKNYLFSSVKNLCLNHIRHAGVRDEYVKKIQQEQQYFSDEDAESESVLFEMLEAEIESMPEKRREIFRMSRRDGLKYREIAEKLNISVKTVEAQMGLAFKYLREKLQAYLTLF